MTVKLPISLRLTLWYSFLFMFALLLFGYLTYVFVSRELYNDQFNYLGENAELITESVRYESGRLDLTHLKEETEELKLNQQGVFFRLVTDSFEPVLQSRNFPPNLELPLTLTAGRQAVREKGSQNRYSLLSTSSRHKISAKEPAQVLYIFVGQSVIYVRRVVERVRILMLFLAPVVLLAAAAGGWLMARRSLRPVAAITEAARDISMHQLSRRLSVPVQNDELKQLVVIFNEMIQRIESGVNQIRQFTADVSHELRTPLTVLRGELEVTLRKPRNSDEYKSTLESGLQELGWMEKIVNDLLLLSRADAGRLAIREKETDFVSLLKECVVKQRLPADKKNITIELRSFGEQIQAQLDEDRMRQVILNLLDNAIKFTPANGHINLTLNEQNNGLLLTLQDTGIGIPEKELSLVFDRFYRVDKSRRREERSSGLGLAICKWIVEAHGGKIEISSKEGQGTTVRLHL